MDLKALRDANAKRQHEIDPNGLITPEYRGNELAGETGEACNLIKKLARERLGIRGSRTTVDRVAEELADVVICVDLVAMMLGIDLGAAVTAKFNKTSEEYGVETRMLSEPAALRVGQRVRDPAGNVGVVGASMSHIVRVEYHDGGSTAWGERSLVPLPDAPAIDTSVAATAHGDARQLSDARLRAITLSEAPLIQGTEIHAVATELLAARERLARQAARIEDYVLANASLEEGLAHATAESDALERERDAAIARCEAAIAERDAVQFGRTADSAAYAAKLGERTRERDAALAEHNAALAARDDLQTELRQVLVIGAERLERMQKAERERDEARAELERVKDECRSVERAASERVGIEREATAVHEKQAASLRGQLTLERENRKNRENELVAEKGELRRQLEAMRPERDALRAQLAARPTHAWSDAEVERMAREAWTATERGLGSTGVCAWTSDGEDGPTPSAAWCRQFARHILVHASPPRASAVVDVEGLARDAHTAMETDIAWYSSHEAYRNHYIAFARHVRDAVLAAQVPSPTVARVVSAARDTMKAGWSNDTLRVLVAALAELDGAK